MDVKKTFEFFILLKQNEHVSENLDPMKSFPFFLCLVKNKLFCHQAELEKKTESIIISYSYYYSKMCQTNILLHTHIISLQLNPFLLRFSDYL